MAKINEKDQESLKMVLERFYRSESYCKAWHDNGEDYYKRYRFYKTAGKYPYKHNVKDRLTFTIIEVITARLMQVLFAVQPFLSIIPTEKTDEPVARQLEKVINNLLMNPDREFFLEFIDFTKQCCIYGTSYLSPTPRFNVDNWKFDGLNFDVDDFFDVFPDPACKRLSRAKFVIKRSIRYWDELKDLEKKGVYKNVDLIKSNTVSDFDNKVFDRQQSVGLNTGVDYSDPVTGLVEIMDYFEEGHIVTIGARGVVLRDTRKDVDRKATLDYMGQPTTKSSVLPYHLPIVDMRFIPVPREFFGIGVPEALKDDQDTIDLLRSNILDNLDLIVNKLFKLRINSDTDPDMVFSAAGNIIPVSDMSDIDEFKVSDISGSAFTVEQETRNAAADAIGEMGPARGQETERRSTATGLVKLQQASLIRFDLLVKNTEFTAIRQIGKKVVQIIREYMSQEQYERIIGEKDAGLYELTPDDIFMLLDIVPVGASVTANKETRSQQIQQAVQMLEKVDPIKAQQNVPSFRINLKELYTMGLEDLDVKNKDNIIMDAPPPLPPQPAPPPPPQQLGMPPMGGAPPMPGGPPPQALLAAVNQPMSMQGGIPF